MIKHEATQHEQSPKTAEVTKRRTTAKLKKIPGKPLIEALLAKLHERQIGIADFCRQSGVGFPYFQKLASGDRNLSHAAVDVIRKMAHAAGLPTINGLLLAGAIEKEDLVIAECVWHRQNKAFPGRLLLEATFKKINEMNLAPSTFCKEIGLDFVHFKSLAKGIHAIPKMRLTEVRKHADFLGISVVDAMIMAEILTPEDFADPRLSDAKTNLAN